MTFSLLTLIACSTPPTVSTIDPSETRPGAQVKILGADFVEGVEIQLVSGETIVPLADAQLRGPVLIEGTLPEDLPSGVYTVRLQFGEAIVSLEEALSITAPEVEIACGGEYTANTQLSLARKVVVIDRFYKNKDRETLRIDFSAVEQVEYELVKRDDATLCSIIYIRQKDGTRVVFDDDTRVDLKERAYKIGSAIGKKVAVTRQDAPAMDKPMEQD
jgi:hypothetical protein